MKFLRWIPFSILACGALFAGRWSAAPIVHWAASLSFNQRHTASAAISQAFYEGQASASADYPTPTFAQPLPPIPQGQPTENSQKPASQTKAARQRNILFLGVDRLDAPTPRLKSAWLVIYLNDKSHFMLMPLFPSQSAAPTGEDGQNSLSARFTLDKNGAPGEAFVDKLAAKEIWWSGYVIMDDEAIAGLLNTIPTTRETGGVEVLEKLPDPNLAPVDAVMEQARLARSLCANANLLGQDEFWRVSGFYAGVRKHVRTDFDREEALLDWEARLKKGGITCEFPSLATAMLLP